MPNALSFLVDPEYWKSVRKTAPNSLANLSKGITAGFLGAPVDIANMALQPIGFGSERPVGGSNQLGRLMGADTNSVPYMVGDMLPTGPDDLARGLPLMAGIFAGKSAKTADLAKLMKAEELRAAGVPDSKIWGETGWTFGFPDKNPRFEIPDNAAKFRETPRENLTLPMPTDRAISHQDLFAAYPDVRDTRTMFDKSLGGSYDGNYIRVGTADAPYPMGTQLHELQHAIQQREGFARGGSPENAPIPFMDEISAIRTAKNKLNIDPYAIQNKRASGYPLQQYEIDRYKTWEDLTTKEDDLLAKSHKVSPHEAYRRLAGEAEARLTQARMNMTPAERAASYPPSMFDVPVENQIVRYGDDVARSVPSSNITELIRQAQSQIEAENAIKNALKYTTNNRVRNTMVGAGAFGAGVGAGYYGIDKATK